MAKSISRLGLSSLLYLSVLFVAIYLFSHDLITMPEIKRLDLFILSIGALLAGFLTDVAGWQVIAKLTIPELKPKHAFISAGKYILTKYIPGKIWIIVGKAAYLKHQYKRSMVELGSGSLFYQIVAIVTGIIASIPILLFIDKTFFMIVLGSLVVMFPLSILLHRSIMGVLEKILGYLLKRPIELPVFSLRLTGKLTLISLATWLLWSTAFYLLLLSMYEASAISITAGLLFPLSSVVGIIVLVAPGGIGIREGLLGLGLMAIGLSAANSTAVAIASRIWFLSAELLVFTTATITWFIEKRRSSH